MAKLDTILFSDVAWVHLDSYINTQNYHLWGSEIPHAYKETGLHPQKIWILCVQVVGPVFFTETITEE